MLSTIFSDAMIPPVEPCVNISVLNMSDVGSGLFAVSDRFFQRLKEGEEHKSDSEGQCEQQQEEILLGHFLPEPTTVPL